MTFTEELRRRGLRPIWLAAELGEDKSRVLNMCWGRARIPAAWMARLAVILKVELIDIVNMQAEWEAKRGEKAEGSKRRRGQKRAA